MLQPTQFYPPQIITLFTFGYDIEQQKYDCRIYTPALTRHRLSLQQVETILGQMNDLAPNESRRRKVVICSVIGLSLLLYLLVTLVAILLDETDLIEFMPGVLLILAIPCSILFKRMFIKSRMKKMQEVLQYYNHKLNGSGFWLCVDTVTESGLPIVQIKCDAANRPVIRGHGGSGLLFNLILNINQDGEVFIPRDVRKMPYTPHLTDGRLSVEEFREVMVFVRMIDLAIAKKITWYVRAAIIMFIAGYPVVIPAADTGYDPFIILGIVIMYTGILMGLAFPCYKSAKHTEKRKLKQSVIDRYNPNIIPLGVRWVYPHTGQGILILNHYLILEMNGGEDNMAIDYVEENGAGHIAIPMTGNNGYGVLH
jgi:hypothetical protein